MDDALFGWDKYLTEVNSITLTHMNQQGLSILVPNGEASLFFAYAKKHVGIKRPADIFFRAFRGIKFTICISMGGTTSDYHIARFDGASRLVEFIRLRD